MKISIDTFFNHDLLIIDGRSHLVSELTCWADHKGNFCVQFRPQDYTTLWVFNPNKVERVDDYYVSITDEESGDDIEFSFLKDGKHTKVDDLLISDKVSVSEIKSIVFSPYPNEDSDEDIDVLITLKDGTSYGDIYSTPKSISDLNEIIEDFLDNNTRNDFC
jgi:hypothetical protein